MVLLSRIKKTENYRDKSTAQNWYTIKPFVQKCPIQIYFLNEKRSLLKINGIGSIAYYFSARHDSDSGHQTIAKIFHIKVNDSIP